MTSPIRPVLSNDSGGGRPALHNARMMATKFLDKRPSLMPGFSIGKKPTLAIGECHHLQCTQSFRDLMLKDGSPMGGSKLESVMI